MTARAEAIPGKIGADFLAIAWPVSGNMTPPSVKTSQRTVKVFSLVICFLPAEAFGRRRVKMIGGK